MSTASSRLALNEIVICFVSSAPHRPQGREELTRGTLGMDGHWDGEENIITKYELYSTYCEFHVK
jgi:hypothetical protein